MGKGLDDARAALALALAAVNSASDAFPPLKSVSGGLLFFVQLAQTIQSNKANYGHLLSRIAAIAHDLANVEDASRSARLVVLRVRAFKTCLEGLQEELQLMSRPYTLRANQHKLIIQSCNDKLDRCTQDFSLWTNLLLIRDVDSLRRTVLEAIAAVGAQVDDLSQHPAAALIQADIHASQAAVLEAVAALASQVDRLPHRPTSNISSPSVTAPQPAAHPSASMHQRASTPGFYFSATREDGVHLHVAPQPCVLFEREVLGAASQLGR